MDKRYWMMKSEPDVFSFADLRSRPKKTEPWNGVRNYQARNYMRDSMRKGDLVLFYHSNAGEESGVVGLAEIASQAAYPDPTQWDSASEYFDAKSPKDNPRWLMVDVKWKADFKRLVSLQEMKGDTALDGMLVVKRGQRLSIQPVDKEHFERVCSLGGAKVTLE